MPKAALAICAFSIAAQAGASEIQLFPAGRFRALDGRPHDVPEGYLMNAAIARRVIDQANARRGDFVLDYEHQTLNSANNGQPAPAAGWFKQLEWREGDGLYAVNVRWTARARQFIADDEYRYISPVFPYDDDTGAVLGLYQAALTNDPGLDGMAKVMAAARREFLTDEDTEIPMLKKLLEALGLDAKTTEDQALGAVASLKSAHDQTDKTLAGVRTALDLDTEADADKIGEAVTALKADRDQAKESAAALKNGTGKPDPSRYVSVASFETIKGELAELKAARVDDQVNDMVAGGLADGRLLPAQEGWARELGKANVAQLKSYLDTSQPIASLTRTQTGGKQPTDAEGNTVLTDNQRAVCKRMGMSEEDYAKSLPASA